MSLARLTVAACLLALSGGARAQDMPLAPLSNYGKVTISATQSGGGRIAFEQAFGGSFDAEPASDYSATSELRRLGRAVGRLDVAFAQGVGYCTAFLISDTHLMTNAHCLEGGQAQAISFIAGYVESGIEEGTRIYSVGTTPVEISPSDKLDYAILQVFGNPAAEWGTLTLAALEIDDRRDAGMTLTVLGHPVFQVAPVPVPQPLYISRKECRAVDDTPLAGQRLRHTCDTLQGNSGSPVISDDSREVIALHHAGSPREGINFAVPMSLIARDSAVVGALLALPPDPVAPDMAALRSELEKLRAERDAALAAAEAARKAEAERKKLAGQLAALQAERLRLQDTPEPDTADPAAEAGLPAHPDRGTLGIRILKVTEDMTGSLGLDRVRGVLIAQVSEGPAKSAGLLAGDVILSAGGHEIEDMRHLMRVIASKPAGAQLEVTYLRGGTTREARPVIAPLSPAAPHAAQSSDILSMTLVPVDDALRARHGLTEAPAGLVVTAVADGSDAHAKGLREGILIAEAGQEVMRDPVDLQRVVATAREQGRLSILLLVYSSVGPRFVALEVGG